MITIAIPIILFLISVITNYRANSISVKLYINSFDTFTYHLGVSSSKFIAKDPSNPHTLSIVSLGLVFLDLEIHFITKINLEDSK